MKFQRLNSMVDFPEQGNDQNIFVNIRSESRIDIRSGESRSVSTGLKAQLNKGETLEIIPAINDIKFDSSMLYSSGEIFVIINNTTNKALQIYPGQSIALVVLHKEEIEKVEE